MAILRYPVAILPQDTIDAFPTARLPHSLSTRVLDGTFSRYSHGSRFVLARAVWCI